MDSPTVLNPSGDPEQQWLKQIATFLGLIFGAIVLEPEILLADEPTGNLDTENSQSALNMMRQLNRSFRQTILMITHNPEAAAVADRILKMRDGQIIYD